MNITAVNNLDLILGFSAIALQIVSVFLLLLLFLGNKKNKVFDFIDKHFIYLGFFVSLIAVIFSLVYSEVIRFTPCELCWFQRIFLFPQVFLFGIALWDKPARPHEGADGDKSVIKYSVPLLCAGFAISIYQNLIYYFGNSSGSICDSSGVSCFQHLVSVFGGYISIPMLALTSFFFLLVITLVVHFYKKD